MEHQPPEIGFRNDLSCKFDRLKFFLGKYKLLYIPLFLSAGGGDEWCMVRAYLNCSECADAFWNAQNQNCTMAATGVSVFSTKSSDFSAYTPNLV
jgi:hypothetical protein